MNALKTYLLSCLAAGNTFVAYDLLVAGGFDPEDVERAESDAIGWLTYWSPDPGACYGCSGQPGDPRMNCDTCPDARENGFTINADALNDDEGGIVLTIPRN
jgi:hypothetical protein